MGNASPVSGPDFSLGVPLAEVPATGVLAGHVGDDAVLLALVDGVPHAVSASCSHYGGPLGEGLRVGDEIRCPWHHACFSLRNGAALKAPAFAALTCWKVELQGDTVFVREPLPAKPAPASATNVREPRRIVLVGGGAAAFACAQRLRERGYDGALTLLSADADAPVDRPNLSKDFLAGSAPAEWIPLQPPEFYAEHRIDLRLGCEAATLDTRARRVQTRSGESLDYDALLLATGAEPIRLNLPGFDAANVHTLRSLADAQALLAGIAQARSVALVGAGFIGMEAAAALRSRGLSVHIVAPDELPLARVLGPQLAGYLTELHRGQGVQFHLGCSVQAFDGRNLALSDGSRIAVDAVIVGIGVRPRSALAESARLAVDNGIVVDACLRTAAPGVYAAGDVASYPHAGERVRIEHWVHAQRQGQCVADNLLGEERAFNDPPFFWTQHYGMDLRYLGHGRGWNHVELDGDPAHGSCLARYYRDGALVAAAAIGRDRELLALQARLRSAP